MEGSDEPHTLASLPMQRDSSVGISQDAGMCHKINVDAWKKRDPLFPATNQTLIIQLPSL
jgi:hypothetical protein